MAWGYSVTVQTNVLDAMMGKFATLGKVMEEVANETADRVKTNIVAKSIIDTGALRDSITYEAEGKDSFVVRDGVEYGIYNEFGTRRGMIARPFFVPAIEQAGSLLREKFVEFIR